MENDAGRGEEARPELIKDLGEVPPLSRACPQSVDEMMPANIAADIWPKLSGNGFPPL